MNEILTQEQFLIDQSVKYINEEWERGLDSWFNIGEHVLDTYFEGNPEKANSRAWNKEHSFYKLCEHTKLKMSPRSLSNCVRIVAQDELFFTAQALAQSLPKAHKILLLPVPSEDKVETAEEIANLSYRDAANWIKKKYKKEGSWLKVDDVWNFSKCEEGYGMPGYPGIILHCP